MHLPDLQITPFNPGHKQMTELMTDKDVFVQCFFSCVCYLHYFDPPCKLCGCPSQLQVEMKKNKPWLTTSLSSTGFFSKWPPGVKFFSKNSLHVIITVHNDYSIYSDEVYWTPNHTVDRDIFVSGFFSQFS
jgi:hypothetical protein